MLLNRHIADIEAKAGLAKTFQLILAVSLFTNLLLAGAFATMDKTVRTVLLPPDVTKSFWVDGHTISPEYLEQMGTWVVQQFTNVTPGTIDYQNDNILRYVHPSVYGDLSVRFKAGANRLKADNVSKVFFPREVRISQQLRAVALIGVQQTWIADKRAGDEQKCFVVIFDYDGSKTTIKELREAGADDPFVAQAKIVSTEQNSVAVAVPSPQVDTAREKSAVAPAAAPAGTGQALPALPPPAATESAEALKDGVLPRAQQNPTR